ncbi:DUF6402 family protein [Pseudomonas citronellolis]|jgi:hypothetical protein|nr:DUF6402 family protein [Pseudomonas citronellolis]AMO78592.1 hypothetical protein PcP3B5_52090 [Pseudomonas citronellolis]MBH3436446.1 hypothetical protein [Pseudomonas citronellolis]WRT85822.1 DUF6402 family protein [Pseudomonas citronellolis]
MPTDFILSKTTPSNQTAGKSAVVDVFKITEIPTSMDRLGWTQGARLMRKWFDNPAYELPMDVKTGKASASMLSPQQLLTDLPFEWLFSTSTRVKAPIDELINNLRNVEEFNEFIGRLRNPLTQLSTGLLVFLMRLKRIGHIDTTNGLLQNADEDFSGLSAMQLEETSQFNFIRIGASLWEKATDDLDDVYGALGSFAIKVAATRFRTRTNDNGWPAIFIDEIGLYIRDSYDFLNVGDDQLLGYWNREKVIRPGPIDYFVEPDYLEKGGSRHFKVSNESFNQYRNKKKKGGDFMVFSTVKHYPVSIRLHLSNVDFQEFADRSAD